MSDYDVTETLDVRGASCSMPVVRTKQAIDDVETGGVGAATVLQRMGEADVQLLV